MTAHNMWEDTGEDVVVTLPLTFRSLDHVTADLAAAGLTVVEVVGGWRDEPYTDRAPLMVIRAQKL